MTSMPVMDTGAAMQNLVSNQGNKLSDMGSGQSSFSNALSKAQKSEPDNKQEQTKQSVEKSSKANETKEASESETKATAKPEKEDKTVAQTKTTEKAESTQTGKEEIPEETSDAVLTAAQTVISAVIQIMNVTPEEVKSAMDDLHLSELDILSADGLKSLALALSDGADQMSMLTDETLYGQVNMMLDTQSVTISELADELSMTSDEMESLLKEMLAGAEAKNLLDGTPVAVEELAQNFANALNTVTKTEVEVSDTTEDTLTALPSTQMSSEDILQDTQSVQGADEKNLFDKNTSGKEDAFEEQQVFVPGQVGSFTDSIRLEQTQMLREESYTVADAQQIMDQILDFMKISVKPEMTNLEMQLHPESMGTLNIQISSKEGVMTAQFTTQSEDVRAVLESQMLDLRENLENQGIKVDAVEVTIAQYDLGREPNQGQGQSQSEAEKHFAQAVRRRSIRLDDLMEEDELSPEDLLTAQVMEANGATVDFTA